MGKFNLNDFLKIQDKSIEEQKAQREENRMKKPAYKIAALHISDLVPSEGNFYSMDRIEELKRDIELAGGVKQNLTVTPIEDGKYKILSGHRRYRACTELVQEGKSEYEFIPCGIEPKQESKEMQAIREELLIITTNSQREKTDWDKVQEAKHLHDVLQRYKSQGGKLPGNLRKIIADTLNTSQTQIGRLEAVGKKLIPEFQEEMKEKRLGISTAYELSGLPKEQQEKALEEYRKKGSFSISDARQKKEKRQQGSVPDSVEEKQDMPPVIPPQQEDPVVSDCFNNKEDIPLKYGDMNTVLGRLENLRDYCIKKQETSGYTSPWEEYEYALSLTIGRIYREYEKATGLIPPVLKGERENNQN